MDPEQKEPRDPFLSRWSRLKKEAREAPVATPVPAAPEARDEEPAPELPALDTLTLDSDFRGFFHPKVHEDVRRAALRKLFADPHFNVMDGLDTYIDDYSKTEPIPAAMLAGMKQAQRILDWAKGKEDEPAPDDEAQEAALTADAQGAAPNVAAAHAEKNEGNDAPLGETPAIAAMPRSGNEVPPDITSVRDAIASPEARLKQT
ncbi:MAG TPA: DUF3306 domain-containing protein [Burkholderiales bacterium]|nr:DUF3306 domain-containing protein [Burkholderiales bacterium]